MHLLAAPPRQLRPGHLRAFGWRGGPAWCAPGASSPARTWPCDGDVRPTVDPRTLYTACPDWIGADPVATLGKRFDDIPLVA
jgi:hypothetical protein